MSVDGIKISEAIDQARSALADDPTISHSMRAIVELLIMIISLLLKKLGLNSSNSSKPPSSDPNRNKDKKKRETGKKPGGQKGHMGSRLEPVPDPDQKIELKIDRRKLPKGSYNETDPEIRQVFDIVLKRVVTEYRAQVLVNEKGERFVASFPNSVTQKTQYGPIVKAQVVYDSQSQLIPYERIAEDLADNANLPISTGSVYNFIKEAYSLLEPFEVIAKQKLLNSKVVHVDETGINIGGKRFWLHTCSSELWTLFMPHKKRGSEAMDHMGVLPLYRGILCHDHWKPYFSYSSTHVLCNAHHLRELERASEQDNCKWAATLKRFLEEANKKKLDNDGRLSLEDQEAYRIKYRQILAAGEIETPPPEPLPNKKPGRIKKSQARNLLERLRDFEEETLRFITAPHIPFTNNQGERDIRMTKVQQKVSGCFRSEEGAKYFARIRAFISTCRKNNISPANALKELFQGKFPNFMNEVL